MEKKNNWDKIIFDEIDKSVSEDSKSMFSKLKSWFSKELISADQNGEKVPQQSLKVKVDQSANVKPEEQKVYSD